MIAAVSHSTEGPALKYLSRSPYLNVFLTHVLLHDPATIVRRNVAVALNGSDVSVSLIAGGRSRSPPSRPRLEPSASTQNAIAANA